MATTKEKFDTAKQYIENKQYDRARGVLEAIDHPKAAEWLTKLDRLDMPDFPSPAVTDGDYSREERTAARMKSYTDKAVFAIILYLFLFIPGMIANEIWYQEGRRMEQIAGQSLPGVGTLAFLRRWVMNILAAGFILLIFVIVLDLLS